MMELIKVLVKAMHMELETADKYYHRAVILKQDYPNVAAILNEVASQELTHCEKFHDCVLNIIDKVKASGKTVPEAMKAIWDYEHALIIEEYDELKYKISKF